jgi:hypothetical protein
MVSKEVFRPAQIAGKFTQPAQNRRRVARKQVSREGNVAISKREFVIGAAAAGGGMSLGRLNAAAPTGRRVIDAHTHSLRRDRDAILGGNAGRAFKL